MKTRARSLASLGLCLCLSGSCFAPAVVQAASSTWTAIPVGTNGSPRGYYEFLPSAYQAQPNKTFPLIIFFHGLGECGDGSVVALAALCRNGPPKILNTAGDPLHEICEQNSTIVLCPQAGPKPSTWWNTSHIRPYLDWVLAHYRVDKTRIVFTGLSAGSQGIHDFIERDPHPDQVAAFLVCAVRGEIITPRGEEIASRCPFWALTAIGDVGYSPAKSVDNIAGFMNGGAPTKVGGAWGRVESIKTANFLPGTGWTYVDGIDGRCDVNPKLTYYPGKSHSDGWTLTYGNAACWKWMFAQQKPTVSITAPTDGRATVNQGQPVSLAGTATSASGTPLTDKSLTWSSDLQGALGTGATIRVSDLNPGVHTIAFRAIDKTFCSQSATVQVTVKGEPKPTAAAK
jgi:poly(3-hydroxybutyrate) depolymerase